MLIITNIEETLANKNPIGESNVKLILQDDLLINAILQEIEDMRIDLNKLNNKVFNLEKKYRELSEFIRAFKNE